MRVVNSPDLSFFGHTSHEFPCLWEVSELHLSLSNSVAWKVCLEETGSGDQSRQV